MFSFFRRFFSPYLAGPACTIEQGCDAPDFPATVGSCLCTTATGGVNELYFIPCTETFSEANLTSTDWWNNLIGTQLEPGALGRSGLGLGSISKKADKKERVASCRTEQITSLTWALKYQIKCFDKTNARSTQKKLSELLLKADKYLVVARMCDGADDVLPIGKFDTTDLNWTVPDNYEDTQVAEIELSWKELGIPTPVTVAGLSAILPKLQ